MKLVERSATDVFNNFLSRIQKEVYSEADSELHSLLIDEMVPQFAKFLPNKQVAIFDVGCGQGYALLKFRGLGFENLAAITLSAEDVQGTRKKGFVCYQMDMSFLNFEEDSFDALWVRHYLTEHLTFLSSVKTTNFIV